MTLVRNLLVAAVVGGTSAALALPTWAEPGRRGDKGDPAPTPVRSAEVSAGARAIAQLELASGLIRYGRESKSPEALLTAAQLFGTTAAQESKVKPSEGKETKPAGKGGTQLEPFPDNSPQALLAEATKLSKNDPHVVARAKVIGGLIDEHPRGPILGHQYDVRTIAGGGTLNYTFTYKVGVPAVVTVAGSGNTDLDLFVYNVDGTLVAQDIGWTDRVDFTPTTSRPYTIQVRNLGGYQNRYRLDTH